jgi:hypothetical protein
MTRKTRTGRPDRTARGDQHPNLLKELGITIVSQGVAVIEEVTRRRWRLRTPDGAVTDHTTEKKAEKAAGEWSDAHLEHPAKTVGVIQIDTRRKARHPRTASAPHRRRGRRRRLRSRPHRS